MTDSRHLVDLLEASAARWPERTAALHPEDGGITYAELDRQSAALAEHLVAVGVRPGDRVAIILRKSIPALVAIFATLKARAAYVPIDHAWPAERARTILEDCEVRTAVVDARSRAVIDGAELAHRDVPLVLVGSGATAPDVSYDEVVRTVPGASPKGRAGSDLAYILFTSGSTGRPKGVMITHANAVSFVDWCSSILAPTEQDRFSSHAPFHFDPSVLDIYVSVKHGATLYLIPEALGRNPRALAAFIAEHRLTIWTSTPSTLIMLVQLGNLAAHDASSLRVVTFGGEVFPIKYLRALQAAWPSPVYYNQYGPTETTTACTFSRIPAPIPPDRDSPYPIGFPCAHCRTALLDLDGRVVEHGEGLLHVGGPSVSPGYWNRPAETSEAFYERDDVRWYNTGDLARWDPNEGFTFVGRRDRMVKRRGFRIELDEIERVLHAHPSVVEAAIVHAPTPDGTSELKAFVAWERASSPSLVQLKTHCASSLPAYMSPDSFVFCETLPRTATGKVDYQQLLHAPPVAPARS